MVVKMTTVGRVFEAKLSGDIEKVNAHAHLVNRRKLEFVLRPVDLLQLNF